MLSKKEFINLLSKKGYTKKDSEIIINDFLDTVTECLANGEDIHFVGFGTFTVKDMAEKRICTPQGEHKICPSYKAPRFTASSSLKRVVKEGFVRPRC